MKIHRTIALWMAVIFLTSCPTMQVKAYEPAAAPAYEPIPLIWSNVSESCPRKAKNLIFFVGDGMNIVTVTAARIMEGQKKGNPGEENFLSFEQMPFTALSKTWGTNCQVPDSANTMTAMMTGVKTKEGVLGYNGDITTDNHTTATPDRLAKTIFEIAAHKGLATGVVSTTRITHATPAACYAHAANRDWESDKDMSSISPGGPAAYAAGVPDIARQLIEFPYGQGLNVALGGGRSKFLPKEVADPEYVGKFGERLDGRNLVTEWLSQPKSAYVWNKAEFDAINPATTKHLLGLFEMSHMQYETDRGSDPGGEPSLSDMTGKAIDILSQNRRGFVLMVEAGRIDHAHHDSKAHKALADTIELSNAVRVAMAKTDPEDTLIVVTADHGHVVTMGGYSTRGNPILGKVIQNDISGNPQPTFSLDKLGLPYTTLTYGIGKKRLVPRENLGPVDTTDKNFVFESAIDVGSETHSGEDMPVYAGGAGAHLFRGVVEQNRLFNLCLQALHLKP